MVESINAKYIQKRNKFKGWEKVAQKTDLVWGYQISMGEKHKDMNFRADKVLEHASTKKCYSKRT